MAGGAGSGADASGLGWPGIGCRCVRDRGRRWGGRRRGSRLRLLRRLRAEAIRAGLRGLRLRRLRRRRLPLEPLEPDLQRGRVRAGTGQQHPRAAPARASAGAHGVAHLDQAGVDQVGRAGELGGAHPACLRTHPLELVGRVLRSAGRDQARQERSGAPAGRACARAGPWRSGGDRGRSPSPARRPRTRPPAPRPPAPRPRRRARAHRRGRAARLRGWRSARRGLRRRSADRAPKGCHERNRRRRARPAAAPPGSTTTPSSTQTWPRKSRSTRGRDQPEGVVVGTRADGLQDLVGLGGGEDELQVRRRLLDQLEQRVERVRGDLVRLVDDVDLESRGGGMKIARSRISRASSMPRWLAASISMTSIERARRGSRRSARRPRTGSGSDR